MQLVSVLLPIAVDKPYTYRVPEGVTVAVGDLVEVTLGRRSVVGVVWDAPFDPLPHEKIKPLVRRLPMRCLPSDLLKFLSWMATYTFAPLGMVLRLAVRSSEALYEVAPQRGVRLSQREQSSLLKVTAARQKVLSVAEDGDIRSQAELARLAGVSSAVVRQLIVAGVLEEIAFNPVTFNPLIPDFHQPSLSALQQQAADYLCEQVRSHSFHTSVLEGVTGSGKTEVYFEAVAATLRENGQALVMVPEISLTNEFLTRFKARFGAEPLVWHSHVSQAKRALTVQDILSGRPLVVVGARSALFLPFPDLRLIVVDEEHEAAYKQEDGVAYHARDMAVVRGSLSKALVVLSSATPSIETRVNADMGRYDRLHLPSRYSGQALPPVSTIDLRAFPPAKGRWLSAPLLTDIEAVLARNEQALLFLNRRGYAPLLLCRTCGHRFHCAACTTALTLHQKRHRLQCHHCGHQEPQPDVCPSCSGRELVACGPGVERVAEEVRLLFPQARVEVLSSDGSEKDISLREQLQRITAGEVDLIIGTQLVAKGHNFPHLTLVGVVDGDLGLATSDPRAAERTFQLMSQVVGRAGRYEKPGRGVIQTHAPDHPVMAALVAEEAEAFYAAEILQRRHAHLPPFYRLIALVVQGKEPMLTERYARALVRAAPSSSVVTLLGPAEAPLFRVRGLYRYRILVRGEKMQDTHAFVRILLNDAPVPPASVEVRVDVDPQSFL